MQSVVNDKSVFDDFEDPKIQKKKTKLKINVIANTRINDWTEEQFDEFMHGEVDAKINFDDPVLIINPCQMTHIEESETIGGLNSSEGSNMPEN